VSHGSPGFYLNRVDTLFLSLLAILI